MIYEHCHRCQAPLPEHDEAELIYCSRCGAPQVELSEELHAQQQGPETTPATPAADLTPAQPMWAAAIRFAGLAAAIAAALVGLSMLFPFAGTFTFLWMLISPVVVIGMVHARNPLGRINAGFGARVGLVTGLGISVVMLAGNAIQLLIMRRQHAPDVINALIAQMKLQPNAGQDPGAMQFIDKLSTVPEYRAGMVLLALGMMVGLLLLASTAAGAFAGFARSRPQDEAATRP